MAGLVYTVVVATRRLVAFRTVNIRPSCQLGVRCSLHTYHTAPVGHASHSSSRPAEGRRLSWPEHGVDFNQPARMAEPRVRCPPVNPLHVTILSKKVIGRIRFAKPNRNRFRILGFRAVDLLNLKTGLLKPTKSYLWFTTAIQDGIVTSNESLTYFA